MSIELTERAAQEVQTIIKQQQESGDGGESSGAGESGGVETAVKPMYLRVGVKGGGCSGFSYSLDITESMQETDEHWIVNGVDVICDSRSLLYLQGTVIDFKDGMMGRGFVFSNPNATSSCGCGSSFSA